jgi:hypothetical protein
MVGDGRTEQVERDLLKDRALVPGSVETWMQQSERSRRYWLKRLARSERRRSEFEQALACDATAVRKWSEFPVTEQREILATIDVVRPFPRKRAIDRAIRRGVMGGSDYRRCEKSS